MKLRKDTYLNKKKYIVSKLKLYLDDIENEIDGKKFKIRHAKKLFDFILNNKYYVKSLSKIQYQDVFIYKKKKYCLIDTINFKIDQLKKELMFSKEKTAREFHNYLYFFENKFNS